ncbi:MAG: hypothetical protein E6I84_01110 [Chloroflexi bacterium]|nr:MAG: hypothetical protein E6I84_01110 [Chloroflexota bacterium]
MFVAAAVALVGLTGCSLPIGAGNCTPKGATTGSAATTVNVVADSQTVGSYQPKTTTVPAGQAVTWTWQDQGNQHSVTADDGSFDSCLHPSGYTFTVTFAKAGTYAYRCSIHSQMTGTITVT